MHNGMHCSDCGYTYFHNAAAAVAGIIEFNGGILLVRRNHEPRKGFWDLPGGFIDYNETAEEALVRELKEELSCSLVSYSYLCSCPNTYTYASVDYFTCDMIFVCSVDSGAPIVLNKEIMELACVKIPDIPWESLAFSSTRTALKHYIASKT
jgi:ADP-ribose pyrophosphatase YjhB (NUDIX family)